MLLHVAVGVLSHPAHPKSQGSGVVEHGNLFYVDGKGANEVTDTLTQNDRARAVCPHTSDSASQDLILTL